MLAVRLNLPASSSGRPARRNLAQGFQPSSAPRRTAPLPLDHSVGQHPCAQGFRPADPHHPAEHLWGPRLDQRGMVETTLSAPLWRLPLSGPRLACCRPRCFSPCPFLEAPQRSPFRTLRQSLGASQAGCCWRCRRYDPLSPHHHPSRPRHPHPHPHLPFSL